MTRRSLRFSTILAVALSLAMLAACGTEPPPVVDQNTLSVTVEGDGEGTVTSQPAGIIVAAGTETATFAPGTQVTLTATPADGSSFTGWTGACTGTGACVVTMDDDRSVTATFTLGEPADATLSVAIEGDGEGTVVSDPAGIDFAAGTETADFAPGTQVTLTAAPADGSFFAGWSGACTGTGACTLTMDEDKSVTATFGLGEPEAFTLTVTVEGDGEGSVTSAPAGIDAAVGETDTAEFDQGTSVTLTATAEEGWDFLGWGGDTCSGLSTTCDVTMTGDTTVTAAFGQLTEADRTYSILTGADDAVEYLEDVSTFYPPGSVDAVTSDLDLTWDTANKPGTSEDRGDVVVGLRYQNVDIPQGATITSATITFTRHAAGRGSPTLVFEGHATSDTPAFVHGGDGSATSGISSRATTNASVDWATPTWTTETITTPDLAAIVQEIVDQADWTSGNALGFTITSPNSNADNFRRADSFESTADGSTAPVLTVTYSLANGNTVD